MPNFAQLEIKTERLLLRPLRVSDAQAVFAIRSNEQVMRYWSTAAWTSIDLAHELIARDLNAMSTGEYLCLGMVRAEDQVLIGTCTLFHFDEQCQRAEIGYGMHYDAWGHGYMHEALLALLEFGFSELGFNRIEADIDPRNEASAKSLVRLGFKKEGHMKERWIVNGEKSDSAWYGLLCSEWQSTNHLRNTGFELPTL